MSKRRSRRRRKRKGRKGIVGVGVGSHHEVSPMGHATRTKSKQEIQLKEDRKNKQNGWDG